MFVLGATLAAALIVEGPPSTPDPSALVDRLGSPRFAHREAAEAELAGLGRAAIPALREARRARDPEVQLRARALLGRIEAATLLEPSPIALDFRDVPIDEAIRAINRRSGLDLTLEPTGLETRLTLRSDAPLPFWEGVDALCRAGGLRHEPGRVGGPFPLRTGTTCSEIPTSDHGPFRVQVEGVRSSSEIRFGRAEDGQGHGPDRQFALDLIVEAEPRLAATQDGPIRVEEAVDHLGRSLAIEARPGLARPEGGSYGMNPASTLRLRIDLTPPRATTSGGRIARLRGRIPLVVEARSSDPVEIPIAEAAATGRAFDGEDAALVVRRFEPARDGRPSAIELSIRPTGPDAPPVDSGAGEPLAYRPDSTARQVEVLDASGRTLPWFPAGISYNGGETRLTMTLSPGKTPATIRHHAIIRATVDVPFEFRDVPIP